jgi:hypothetical protein
MYRRWIGILVLGLLVTGSTLAPRTAAEEKRPAKPEKLPADLSFVYESGDSFVALRPGDLLDSAPLKKMPPRVKEQLKKEAEHVQQHLGVALADIERVSILLPSDRTPGPVVVVRTLKNFDREAVLGRLLGAEPRQEKYRAFTLFTSKGREAMSLCTIDAQTFVIGPGREMRETLNRADGRTTPRPHGQAVEWAAQHQVVLGATATPLLAWVASGRAASAPAAVEKSAPAEGKAAPPRPDPGEKKQAPPETRPPEPIKEKRGRADTVREEYLVSQRLDRAEEAREETGVAEMLAELPPAALPYKPLLQAESLAVALDLGGETKVRWQFTFADAESAAEGETAARVALYVGREMLARLPHEMRVTKESSPKLLAAIKDVQEAVKAAAVERRGNTVGGGLTLKSGEDAVGAFFEETEKAVNSSVGRGQLTQIGIAMHNYHDTTGTFPGVAICDKAGKPLLSWRVAILPFIEEDNLYKQFKLDEPWNSEHNLKLLDRMPKTYTLAGREAKKGETFFRVFTGPGTPFDPTGKLPAIGPRIAQFTDGLSNTLLVVEAADAVPWTKPDELVVDPKKPLPKLGGLRHDGFLAVFADGATRVVPHRIGEKTLRLLIDPADGTPVDWDQIEPGREGAKPRPARTQPDDPPPLNRSAPAKPPEPAKPDPERKPERR